MTDWWTALSLELQIFYVIGITALLLTVVQTVLSLIGLGFDSLDIHTDISSSGHGHPTGIGIFSIQTISAFFMGFGWGGVFSLHVGLSIYFAVFIAFNFGGLLMFLMYFLLIGLLSLQDSGNMNYSSAVGETGEVYVTVPANRGGNGQIQVMINGRLATVNAETDSNHDLNPGQNVRVLKLIGSSDFLVELT
jgi:membrane protein implicated in regulation of membrane protease activity